jgi:hypothetical protein
MGSQYLPDFSKDCIFNQLERAQIRRTKLLERGSQVLRPPSLQELSPRETTIFTFTQLCSVKACFLRQY